ncbi:hypothetical protein ICN84_11745 [Akkermansia glycaniphila]|uniref:hypothetical protein n=1 Tax=Akkermansia glycaniphila TaxID=1679444 RepID=UPI001C01437A|nr:hypothetical protein [Akkermansia glycaniphila]MBT9450740.1 hypothetical protein [Akkermansia glycaniphila]
MDTPSLFEELSAYGSLGCAIASFIVAGITYKIGSRSLKISNNSIKIAHEANQATLDANQRCKDESQVAFYSMLLHRTTDPRFVTACNIAYCFYKDIIKRQLNTHAQIKSIMTQSFSTLIKTTCPTVTSVAGSLDYVASIKTRDFSDFNSTQEAISYIFRNLFLIMRIQTIGKYNDEELSFIVYTVIGRYCFFALYVCRKLDTTWEKEWQSIQSLFQERLIKHHVRLLKLDDL